MYHLHLDFRQPKETKASIWRYLALWKLEDLLEKRALYFARPDRFEDPWEGHFTKVDIQDRLERYPHVPMDIQAAHIRQIVGLSCWHINGFESEGFWKLYLPDNEGVAIQSTVEGLVESIDDNPSQHVSIGLVTYVDYERFHIDLNNELLPLFYKRKEFEYERELRAIVGLRRRDGRGGYHWIRSPLDGGVHVGVDLEKLIHRVVLSPGASCDSEARVANAMKGAGIRAGRVTRSRLEDNPEYDLPLRSFERDSTAEHPLPPGDRFRRLSGEGKFDATDT